MFILQFINTGIWLKEKIRCDACPVMCYIAEGKYGACDRYANKNGEIVRLDPLIILNNCIIKQ